MKRWTQIFKALANINRLKIIKILSDRRKRSVTDISEKLGISLKATSKHLILLDNLDILENKGKDGHVWYYLNPDIPDDIKKVINHFV